MPPQSKVEGGQELKRTNRRTLQSWFPNTSKNPFHVALLLLQFQKMICRTEGGAPIAL
jgi:hypothetical protein